MAIIKCKECKKEVSNTAEKCPHCGAAVKRKPIGCGSAIVLVVLVLILGAVIGPMISGNGRSNDFAVTSPTPRAAVACNTDAARKVKDLVQGLAKTSQDSGFIRVQWGNGFHAWGRDQQLQMAQTFANADACLSGSAREIRFYSPAGTFNAVATPSGGVRLID